MTIDFVQWLAARHRQHKITTETYMLHDKDIREPLFEYLEELYGKIRIIE